MESGVVEEYFLFKEGIKKIRFLCTALCLYLIKLYYLVVMNDGNVVGLSQLLSSMNSTKFRVSL